MIFRTVAGLLATLATAPPTSPFEVHGALTRLEAWPAIAQNHGVLGCAPASPHPVPLDPADTAVHLTAQDIQRVVGGLQGSGPVQRSRCHDASKFFSPTSRSHPLHLFHGGAMAFSTAIHRFGLVASSNGRLYITAWDTRGRIIGQINRQPSGHEVFVGIDSGPTAIGFVMVGNDDLWNGEGSSAAGPTVITEDWYWSS